MVNWSCIRHLVPLISGPERQGATSTFFVTQMAPTAVSPVANAALSGCNGYASLFLMVRRMPSTAKSYNTGFNYSFLSTTIWTLYSTPLWEHLCRTGHLQSDATVLGREPHAR